MQALPPVPPEDRKHDPKPDPRKWSDTDIVTGLRSEDPKRRQAALESLTGGINGACLMICTPRENRVSVTNNLRADQAFIGLLFITQQVAKALGLHLAWAPEKPADDGGGIVIANPDMIPPKR